MMDKSNEISIFLLTRPHINFFFKLRGNFFLCFLQSFSCAFFFKKICYPSLHCHLFMAAQHQVRPTFSTRHKITPLKSCGQIRSYSQNSMHPKDFITIEIKTMQRVKALPEVRSLSCPCLEPFSITPNKVLGTQSTQISVLICLT